MSEQQHDPWVVQPGGQHEQVPVGSYLAKFRSVADFDLPGVPDDPHRWRWTWTITAGEFAGKEASSLTPREIKPTTLAGKLISGLLGRQVKPGEKVNDALNACSGQPYLIVVALGDKGGKAAVRMVSKPPAM